MGCTSAYAQEPTLGFNDVIFESILTPDIVETTIGKLTFFDGMPHAETVGSLR